MEPDAGENRQFFVSLADSSLPSALGKLRPLVAGRILSGAALRSAGRDTLRADSVDAMGESATAER